MQQITPRTTPIAFALAATTTAWGQPAVEYHVDLSQRNQQIVTIEVDVPAESEAVELLLPVWRPGRYGVLDFAATVREYEAFDDAGAPLRVEKIRKNAWRIDSDGADEVTFRYSIFADALGNRTRHADDSHVFLSGSSVFVLSPPHRNDEHAVHLDLPDGWAVSTGLEATGDAWLAESYDTLIDSPIEMGTHQRHIFDVEGVTTEVAVWGDVEPGWQLIEEDFSAVARVQHEILGGDIHFDRYVYIVHAYPGGGGGTEHLNSSVCQTRPATFTDADRWKRFMSLIAHEYFHTWNVKRFRPAELVPYEFDREDYTRMLWLVEGSTSYYDDLTLVRGGIIEPNEYLNIVASSVARTETRAGRARSSLTESSFDAWLKLWGPGSPDHTNTTVNVYTHGAMASLALDLLIRGASGGEGTYDDVMRSLNARFDWRTSGYTMGDVIKACNDAAGTSMSRFFDAHITGRELPPMDEALLLAGIERVEDDDAPGVLFGASTTSADGGRRITQLLDGSPAFNAGLNVDDVIIAIDGASAAAQDIDKLLAGAAIGDTARVTISRREAIREIEVVLDHARPRAFSYERVAEPTASQRAMYEAWLWQPWPGDEAE